MATAYECRGLEREAIAGDAPRVLQPADRQKLLKLLKFGPRLPRKDLARYAVEMAKRAA